MSEVSWHCCSALLWSLIFWSGHVTTQTHPPTLSCPHCSHSPDSQPSCSHTSPTHTTTSDNCIDELFQLNSTCSWRQPGQYWRQDSGAWWSQVTDCHHITLSSLMMILMMRWEWWWWVVMIRSRDVSQCCDGNQSWSWAGTDHWWPQDRDTGAQSPAPVSRSQATLAACLALLSPPLSPAATQAYTPTDNR